jgi:hypothetical protein
MATSEEGGKDHILEGFTIAQSVPRTDLVHAFENLAARSVGMSMEGRSTAWAIEFDLHEKPPVGIDRNVSFAMIESKARRVPIGVVFLRKFSPFA